MCTAGDSVVPGGVPPYPLTQAYGGKHHPLPSNGPISSRPVAFCG